MGSTKVSKVLIALAAVCASLVVGSKAGAVSSDSVKITTDKASAKVSVSIGEQTLNGKNVSVVCYLPGFTGDETNLEANSKYLEYVGQTKVGADAFSFPLKGSVQTGDYTLVIGYTGGKIIKKFNFNEVSPSPLPSPSPIKLDLRVMNVKARQCAATKVEVSWTRMKNVGKYTINRSAKKSGPFKKVGTSKESTFIDRNLKAGKTYYYEVIMNKSESGKYPVKVTLMKKPVIKVSAGKASAVIKWKKDPNATGYKIYMSQKKKKGYKVVDTINSGKKVKATVKKLKKGSRYYFKVCAFRKIGLRNVVGVSSAAKSVKAK